MAASVVLVSLLSLTVPASAGLAALAPTVFFDDGPEDPEWHLERTRVFAAWELLEARGIAPGEGILIAHPDTGYTLHPELHPDGPGGWALASSWSFIEDRPDGYDDLKSRGLIDLPGHGTHAASVMVSPRGPAPGASKDAPFISGVAPAARVLPIRTSTSVILTHPERLAAGIRHAIEAGAHIITLTVGTPLAHTDVAAAIDEAIERGILVVVAAAGNDVPFVVYPGAFPNVITVAGTDPDDAPWSRSSAGPEVDVAAPALDVPCAYPYRDLFREAVEMPVVSSWGTTLATSQVAGAAALWLSYHGREALLARYRARGLQAAFRRHLRETTWRPDGWPDDRYGAGLLDAAALLRAPL